MGYFFGGFRGAGTASTVRVQIKNPTQCLSWWRLSNIPMPQTVCNLCNVCVSGNRFEIECLNLVASTLLKLRQQKKHYACRTLLWHCVLIKSSTGRGNEVKISFASAISIRIYSRMMKWYVFDFTSCWILCLCVADMMKDVIVFETAFGGNQLLRLLATSECFPMTKRQRMFFWWQQHIMFMAFNFMPCLSQHSSYWKFNFEEFGPSCSTVCSRSGPTRLWSVLLWIWSTRHDVWSKHGSQQSPWKVNEFFAEIQSNSVSP